MAFGYLSTDIRSKVEISAHRNRELDSTIVKSSAEYISCDGLRIAFLRAGAGSAVVLIHGLLGYSFSWRNVIPVLAQDREVFALDMPGAGFSECNAGLDCKIASAANRLLAFLHASKIENYDLVGSSYGGATAIMAAGLAPSRVRSLVLVSPANPWSQIGQKRLALLRNSAVKRVFPKFARAVRPMHRYFVRRMWGDPATVTEETLAGYSRPLMRSGIFEHAVKIVQSWREDMAEVQAMLPKIAHIPTLLVWGSRDRVVDLASAQLLQRNLPETQMAVIEGAGHLPYEERPEEFSRIVLEFLERSSAGATRKVT